MLNTDIKIFFEDRFVILTDKKVPADQQNAYVFEDKQLLAKRLKQFENSQDEQLSVHHNDPKELLYCVKKNFKFVEAAGGLVMLPDGRVLMIKRLGKWDLPKGKVENKESLHGAALREVVEECGLVQTPEIVGEMAQTFHTYYQGGKHILKNTVWYAMLYEGNETLKPQVAENITKAVWFPQNLLNFVMQNTYQSIKQVLMTIKT